MIRKTERFPGRRVPKEHADNHYKKELFQKRAGGTVWVFLIDSDRLSEGNSPPPRWIVNETFTPDEIVLDTDYKPRDYPPAADTTPDAVPVTEEPAVVDAHTDSSRSTGEAVGLGAAAGAASTVAQSAAYTESSRSVTSRSATLGDRYQSSYTDRIRQTPSLESNRWAGERGE